MTMATRRTTIAAVLALCLAALPGLSPQARAQGAGPVVFAAASLLQTSPVLVLLDVGLGAALVAKLLRDLARGRPANLNSRR